MPFMPWRPAACECSANAKAAVRSAASVAAVKARMVVSSSGVMPGEIRRESASRIRRGALPRSAERVADAVRLEHGVESRHVVREHEQVVRLAVAVLHVVAQEAFGPEAEPLEGAQRGALIGRHARGDLLEAGRERLGYPARGAFPDRAPAR